MQTFSLPAPKITNKGKTSKLIDFGAFNSPNGEVAWSNFTLTVYNDGDWNYRFDHITSARRANFSFSFYFFTQTTLQKNPPYRIFDIHTTAIETFPTGKGSHGEPGNERFMRYDWSRLATVAVAGTCFATFDTGG